MNNISWNHHYIKGLVGTFGINVQDFKLLLPNSVGIDDLYEGKNCRIITFGKTTQTIKKYNTRIIFGLRGAHLY